MTRVVRARTVTAATGVTTSARLLGRGLVMRVMQEQRNQSSPEKEDGLHNTDSERSLEHGACFVDLQRKRVVGALAPGAKGTQRDPD